MVTTHGDRIVIGVNDDDEHRVGVGLVSPAAGFKLVAELSQNPSYVPTVDLTTCIAREKTRRFRVQPAPFQVRPDQLLLRIVLAEKDGPRDAVTHAPIPGRRAVPPRDRSLMDLGRVERAYDDRLDDPVASLP